MPTVKFVFVTPTDNVTASEDLDILIYNGTLGNEVLYETVLGPDPRKTIVGANTEIVNVSVTASTTYNFSAKARDEAGNLSAAFSPITIHTTAGGTTYDVTWNGVSILTGVPSAEDTNYNSVVVI